MCMWRRTGGGHCLLKPRNFEQWWQKQRSQLLDDLFWLKLSWYMAGAGNRPWKIVKGIDESCISVTGGHQIHGIDLLSADTVVSH